MMKLRTPAAIFYSLLMLYALALPFAAGGRSESLYYTLLITNAVMVAAFAWLAAARKRPRLEIYVKPSHFVQAGAQSSIYFYWGHYYFGVMEFAPLIVYQLVLAYAVDFLLSAWRDKPVRLGFSPLPIVLSINLFIWAKPDYFFCQILMVVMAVAGKAYLLRSNEAGERRHIFNPSALALAVMSLFTLLAGVSHWFNTRDVVLSYMAVPHFYTFVFLVGCLSHWVGRVSFISLGTVATLAGYDFIVTALLGRPPMESMVHQSIFIGLTLLVTDPATSPRSARAQLLYGCLYGLGIAAAHALLIVLQQPRYFDKILVVPLLNLMTPYLERLRAPRLEWAAVLRSRWAPVALYALVFVSLLPLIESKFYQVTAIRKSAGFPPKADPRLNEVLIERWRRQCAGDPALPVCAHF